MKNKIGEYINILFHPVDGFEQMKYRKTGSVGISTGIVLLWFIISSIERQMTHFRFNAFDTKNTNVLYIFISTFILFVFYCVANWSLCTLLDGEGTLREIWIAAGYSLTPMVLTTLISVILSHFLSVREGSFIGILTGFGVLWTGFLLLFGMMQVHRYDFKKTVFSIIGSFIGLVLILFLSFLVILLFQQMGDFLKSVYREIFYRL